MENGIHERQTTMDSPLGKRSIERLYSGAKGITDCYNDQQLRQENFHMSCGQYTRNVAARCGTRDIAWLVQMTVGKELPPSRCSAGFPDPTCDKVL